KGRIPERSETELAAQKRTPKTRPVRPTANAKTRKDLSGVEPTRKVIPDGDMKRFVRSGERISQTKLPTRPDERIASRVAEPRRTGSTCRSLAAFDRIPLRDAADPTDIPAAERLRAGVPQRAPLIATDMRAPRKDFLMRP